VATTGTTRQQDAPTTAGTLDAAAMHRAVSSLRAIAEVSRLIERAPAVLCEECGFDRAVLFRIDGTEMLAVSAYFGGDPTWEAEFLARAQLARPELTHKLLETEMVRRRTPLLVADPQTNDKAFAELVDASRTRAYVAAPIVSGRHVIGALHADRYFSQTPLTQADLSLLSLYVEAFACVFERAAVAERSALLRRELGALLASVGLLVDDVVDAPLTLEASSPAQYGILPVVSDRRQAAANLGTLLTKREQEILTLMADGATNRMIADELVIAEGTVKSHVKRILRKLRAANRAEAVSRYLRLSRPVQ
jgi:DNA-binding CsgD family transcriptional regulator